MRLLSRRRAARDREAQMTLLEHLEELRYRLVWVIAAVAVSAIAGWVLFDRVVGLLIQPACPFLQRTPGACTLVFTGPLEAFTLRIKVAAYVGFAIAFPVVLFHFWRFVAPGLHAREKKFAVPFVVSGMVLFSVGVAFAFLTLPQAMVWLVGQGITGRFIAPLLKARDYITFVLLYLLSFGLAFEFPLVLMSLTLARVLSSRQMARYRRHVLVGIAVVVAVGTPTVDLFSMAVLTAAMYVLYEACIWISRFLKR